eukprot:CAMPEP_0177201768 /NCGR_PEP_ID=MMETSP0367-20130122/26931_1 /TAXON_ID=447022 ORGANISM="Scrippsiella hangoei-like, Strain SHHI-4" /NCGR_SAMPLE_ID=MMETSP0367 /ASSEMBLY_ACC=CAM_ASM_000362 /LENGTH=496 /DNA_ID=CAMNT_0018650301 /DNA_START=69 /DNA_END=1555 /DNA_ORIENTATION=-
MVRNGSYDAAPQTDEAFELFIEAQEEFSAPAAAPLPLPPHRAGAGCRLLAVSAALALGAAVRARPGRAAVALEQAAGQVVRLDERYDQTSVLISQVARLGGATGEDEAKNGKHDSKAVAGDEGQDDATAEEHDGVLATCPDCLQRHSMPQPLNSTSRAFLRSNPGAMDVDWFGETQKKYFEGAEIVKHGKGMVLTMAPFEKVYLMNSEMHTSTNPADFAMLQLVGNSISLNVDMGADGPSCGCNVAFFLVSMPGQGGGDHYCDANCVGGHCCAEFDLLEMTVHTLQVTNHACSDYRKPPHDSQPSSCDHGGSPIVKFGNGAQDFGPGDRFTINADKPFEFKMEFPVEGGVLKGHITLTQEGRTARQSMNNLDSMKQALEDGMALVLDAWHSSDLTWLDGGACHTPESCNMKPTVFDSMKLEHLNHEEATGGADREAAAEAAALAPDRPAIAGAIGRTRSVAAATTAASAIAAVVVSTRVANASGRGELQRQVLRYT